MRRILLIRAFLRGFLENVEELVPLGYGYLQSLLCPLARLVLSDEPLTAPVCHNASILSSHPMSSQHNHELALARAFHHLQNLKRRVANWRDGHNYRVIHNFERERGESVFRVDDVEPPEPETFSVIVGDCLHNLSSSLNYLAYALAVAHTDPLPEKAADEVEFPIFGDVDRQEQARSGPRLFRKNAPKRIRNMDPKAQTEIEGLQPYKRSTPFTDDPLWKLYELARFNRHRFLHPAVAGFSGVGIDTRRTVNASIGPGILRIHGGLIEGRTEIASIPARPTDPSKEMYVHLEPSIGVAFAKGTPVVAGESMVEVLSRIYNDIVFAVLPRLTPYLT